MRDEVTNPRKQWTLMALIAALSLPGLLIRFTIFSISTGYDTLLFGVAILGAAFLLSWAAEVAQLDISQGLAIAFLAFIAVLPEYAVGLVFAWKGGHQDRLAQKLCEGQSCAQLTLANMTGANRLLIGLGWAVVVLVWWKRSGKRSVGLPIARRSDLGFMFLATLWAVTIVIRQQIALWDTLVLGALFVGYIWHVAKEDTEHPDLIGPPLAIAALSTARRRLVTIAMFVYAAGAILAAAEPFAEGLKQTGHNLGISQFLLVQWLAPLASEAPEMIIAILFVLRAKPEQGLGTLVSSKVNQWTVLIGTVPIVYGLAYGSISHPLHLEARQTEEVLLTAAQSLFAAAVLANLTISRGEAVGLMVLFIAQFGFENTNVRYGFAAAYLLGFVVLLAKDKSSREGLWRAVRHALSKPSTEET